MDVSKILKMVANIAIEGERFEVGNVEVLHKLEASTDDWQAKLADYLSDSEIQPLFRKHVERKHHVKLTQPLIYHAVLNDSEVSGNKKAFQIIGHVIVALGDSVEEGVVALPHQVSRAWAKLKGKKTDAFITAIKDDDEAIVKTVALKDFLSEFISCGEDDPPIAFVGDVGTKEWETGPKLNPLIDEESGQDDEGPPEEDDGEDLGSPHDSEREEAPDEAPPAQIKGRVARMEAEDSDEEDAGPAQPPPPPQQPQRKRTTKNKPAQVTPKAAGSTPAKTSYAKKVNVTNPGGKLRKSASSHKRSADDDDEPPKLSKKKTKTNNGQDGREHHDEDFKRNWNDVLVEFVGGDNFRLSEVLINRGLVNQDTSNAACAEMFTNIFHLH